MYKRYMLALAIFLVALLVLTPGGLEALFAFLFVGMIPMTNLVIPPSVMLIVYVTLIVLGVRWIASQLFFVDLRKRDLALRQKARVKVTKKVARTQTGTKNAKSQQSYQRAKVKA